MLGVIAIRSYSTISKMSQIPRKVKIVCPTCGKLRTPAVTKEGVPIEGATVGCTNRNHGNIDDISKCPTFATFCHCDIPKSVKPALDNTVTNVHPLLQTMLPPQQPQIPLSALLNQIQAMSNMMAEFQMQIRKLEQTCQSQAEQIAALERRRGGTDEVVCNLVERVEELEGVSAAVKTNAINNPKPKKTFKHQFAPRNANSEENVVPEEVVEKQFKKKPYKPYYKNNKAKNQDAEQLESKQSYRNSNDNTKPYNQAKPKKTINLGVTDQSFGDIKWGDVMDEAN